MSFSLRSSECVSVKGLCETAATYKPPHIWAFVFVTEQGQGICNSISGTSHKEKSVAPEYRACYITASSYLHEKLTAH
jgi:hypothetical protein